MEWILASLALVIAALSGVVFLLARRQQALEIRQKEQLRQLSELQSAICGMRRQLQLLQAQPTSFAADEDRQASLDPLESIEHLGETAALTNADALKNAARHISSLPPGVVADLFEADQKLIAISRLVEHGHSLPEVARRLNLTIGEVELLSSLRS
jgi:TolA-binding protein